MMGRSWVAGINWEGRKEEKLWSGYKIITILLLLLRIIILKQMLIKEQKGTD